MSQEEIRKQLLITSGILDGYQCKFIYINKTDFIFKSYYFRCY